MSTTAEIPQPRRRRKSPSEGPRLTWITNRSVARQLKLLDCSVVALFVDIARDRSVEAAVRFRAAERLAALLFGPRMTDRDTDAPPVDLSAIIAHTWPGMKSLSAAGATAPAAGAPPTGEKDAPS